MPAEAHFRRLGRLYQAAPTNAYYQPRLTVGEGWAEVVIPVRPEFFHAAGAVHGSVYFKALDDAAYFAANSLVEDAFVLTASFNLYLTRPISEGEIRGRGDVVHRSQRLIVAESALTDERGRPIARGSGTFLRSSLPLGAEAGEP
jgi:uncharacterized protein (TIGR00369 family)